MVYTGPGAPDMVPAMPKDAEITPQTDAAIVLGAAVWADEEPSPTLRRRARHAANLYLSGQVSRIIACGGLGKHPPTEAEMIRRICVADGVAEADILLEDQSTTTRENLIHAQEMMQTAGLTTVLIVTDRYHAPRARFMARSLGMAAATSCPDLSGTDRWRVARSYAREVPALALYLFRHLTGR